MEELRDKSDSESLEDEIGKLMNAKKAKEADQLRGKLKALEVELDEARKNK